MTTLISPSSTGSDGDILAARQARNTFRAAVILFGASIATAAVEIYLVLQNGAWQLYLAITVLLSLAVVTLVSALLSRRGRADLGAWLLIGAMLVSIVAIASLLSGLGMPVGLAALLATVAISTQTLPQRLVNWVMIAGVIAGVLAGLLDLLRTPFQLVVPELLAVVPFILVGTMLVYGFLVARQFPSYSLPSKLIVAFLTVSVISVGAVEIFTDRAIRDTLTEQIGAGLKNQAELQASAVGDLLVRQVDILQAFSLSERVQNAVDAANAGYRGSPAAIQAEIDRLDQQWRAADAAGDDSVSLVQTRLDNEAAAELREYRDSFPENVEVFVTDRYGANVAATNRTSDYYQADEDWWQAAFNEGLGATYVGQPEYDASSDSFSSNIAVPLYRHGTQEIIGVLRTTVQLEAVTGLLETARADLAAQIDVLLPDGTWLKPDGAVPAAPELVTALQAAAAQAYAELDFEGVPSLVGQAPVSSIGSDEASTISQLGWTIVVRESRAESLAPVETQARGSLLIAVVIAGMMASAAVGMGHLLAAPIARLTAVARRVAAGDLSAQAEAESSDEIGALALTFNSMTGQLRDLIGTLEARVEARTEQLRASADVGRAAVSVHDPDRLLSEATKLISDRFGFYYAALFTLDEAGEFAVLRAATGEAGRILKERGHKLQVGGESMVGTAIATRKPRIALDVGEEPMRFANPLLPETRSEIALPLAVGERVFGALDVQSTEEAAFDETSAAVLQAMADQIAIALNNASSYAEAQAAVQRASALYQASQQVGRLEVDLSTLVDDMLRTVGDLLGFSQWWVLQFDERRESLITVASTLTDLDPLPGVRLDQLDNPIVRSAVYAETHVINDPDRDARLLGVPADQRVSFKSVSVPIVARGTSIGVLVFGRSIDAPDLSAHDLEVSQSLASLIAITIENRNLFERTRRALDDLDAVNRRLTEEAWTSFSRRLTRGGVMWIGAGSADDSSWLPEIGEALALGRIAVRPTSEDGNLGVAVPIQLRGAPLGALRLTLPERLWSAEMAATLESIAGHVAQSAENARLVEAAEERARRERALAESTDKIRRTADMERILQTAAEELARHLNAARVAVRLDVNDDAMNDRDGGGVGQVG